jgi:hypothetical protein
MCSGRCVHAAKVWSTFALMALRLRSFTTTGCAGADKEIDVKHDSCDEHSSRGGRCG